MFDFIPLQYYSNIQFHTLLVIAVMILLHAQAYEINNRKSINFFNVVGYFILVFFILYMGLRPLSGRYFGDTSTYANAYSLLQKGAAVRIEKDYVFNYFMAFCSKIMDIHTFFLLVDVLYVIPFFLFSKKYFRSYWFFAFFLFIGSFSTWSYGTNGLRNGLGTSFFIMAMYFYDQKKWMYAWLILSYFMHASLIIPIAAFLVSGVYKNPKIYIYIWIASIPLSLVGGSIWSSIFSSLGFAEDRTQGYLTGGDEFKEQFSNTGFRWDFLVYSSAAIFAGYYFIFKKHITDRFYIHLFGIYCIANAFWILVITATFSNRFAYLSWFLMPAIFAYPIFRYKIWKDQYKTFGIIVFLYYMFTYFMNVLK